MAIVSFLIAAGVASFTAFAYAEFSAICPESGGGYAYVSNVFDTDLIYFVGWSMIPRLPRLGRLPRRLPPRLVLPLRPPLPRPPPPTVPYRASGLAILTLLVAVNARSTVQHVAGLVGDVPVDAEVLDAGDVVATVVTGTADPDLTIIGATREGLLRELVFGAIPEGAGRPVPQHGLHGQAIPRPRLQVPPVAPLGTAVHPPATGALPASPDGLLPSRADRWPWPRSPTDR